MTDFRITVVVDPNRAQRGIKQVERSLDRVGKTADRTRGLIARAFAFGFLAIGIRQLVTLADTFTNIQNRLKTVTNGTGELAAVTQELFKIANRTRSSFEGTAEVFSRVGLAVRELGISQRQTLQFTESLNQAVLLSGASAQEANAGLIQLSQGLASGTLRGDELRSVLEQLPVVADVIAKSLGVTRGELRQLGTDGKINAEVVLQAFKEARIELADRFGKTIPTISQSFQVLRNNIVGFIGSLDESTAASRALSSLILLVAENVDTLARSFAAAAIIVGVQFARIGVGAAITAVNTLTLAIAANPVGALVVGITAAIALLIAFSDEIMVSANGAATLADVFIVSFELISTGLSKLVSLFVPAFDVIISAVEAIVGPINLSFQGVLESGANMLDALIGLFVGTSDAIVVAFREIPIALEAIFVKGFNAVSAKLNEFLNGIIVRINRIFAFVGIDAGIQFSDGFTLKVSENVVGAGENIGKKMDEALANGIKNSTAAKDAVTGVFTEAEARAQRRLQSGLADVETSIGISSALDIAGTRRASSAASTASKAEQKLKDFIRNLGRENKLLKLNNQERAVQEALFRATDIAKRALNETERASIEGLVISNQTLERQRALLEEIKGPEQERQLQLEALNVLLDEGSISSSEFAFATKNLVSEYDSFITSLEEENRLVGLSNTQRAVAEALTRAEAAAKRELTEAEVAHVTALVRANEARRQETDLLNDITGPQQSYNTNMSTLNRLLERGAISTDQFTDKQREFRIALLETQKTFEAGFERGILKVQEDMSDFASDAENLVTKAFSGMEDALTEFVSTGKLDFKSLADSIIADITRIAIKSAILKPLADAFGGGGDSGGGGGLFGGLFGGGGGGGGGIGGLFGGGGGGGFGSIFSSIGGLFGFANGGDFKVNGTPGVDRNILSINNKPVAKVSKGETVAVTPQSGGGGGRPIQVVYNISTPDANSFQRSQDQILSRTQAQLSRAQRRNS